MVAYAKNEPFSWTKNVVSCALDGLDGCGKGELAKAVAKTVRNKGINVVVCDYPQYGLPFGRLLDRLLHENDEDLSIAERMAVYALNRRESLPNIEKAVRSAYGKNGANILILFDRYPTSNLITLAYYILKEGKESKVKAMFKHYWPYMWQIDSLLVSRLELENAPVFVPVIDPDVALKAISHDETRVGRDGYEALPVQRIAEQLYLLASHQDSRVKLLHQYKKGSRRRLSPAAIAKELVGELSLPARRTNEIGTVTALHLSRGGLTLPEIEHFFQENGGEKRFRRLIRIVRRDGLLGSSKRQAPRARA